MEMTDFTIDQANLARLPIAGKRGQPVVMVQGWYAFRLTPPAKSRVSPKDGALSARKGSIRQPQTTGLAKPVSVPAYGCVCCLLTPEALVMF